MIEADWPARSAILRDYYCKSRVFDLHAWLENNCFDLNTPELGGVNNCDSDIIIPFVEVRMIIPL